MARADHQGLMACLMVAGLCTGAARGEDLDSLFEDAPPRAETADPAAPPRPLDAITLPPAGLPGPARAAEKRVIEEIVVTAQKTQQNIQEVPVSVSTINADTLRESGSFDSSSLENFVPNVEIDIDPQAPVIGIRGFATDADNVGFEPAVGLVMDELALGRGEFIPDGLFDIERVEVLRGPQGTLFGKNTIAGVINFVTADADLQNGGQLLATVGNPDRRRLEAASSIPLTDRLSGRVAAVYWDQTGDMHNTKLNRTEGNFTQSAARLKLKYQPNDSWTVRGQLQRSNTRADSYPAWQLYDAPESVLTFNRNYDPRVEDEPLNQQTSFNRPGFVDRDSELQSLILEHAGGRFLGLEDLTTTGIVGHAAFELSTIIDIDVSPADIIITDFANNYSQDSLELRTAGASESLFGFGSETEFVVGVYAYQADLISRLDTLAGEDLAAFGASPAGVQTLGGPDTSDLAALLALLPTAPGATIQDELLRRFHQDARSYAAFGQITWHWSEDWAVIAGLRIGRETKTGRFDVSSVGPGIISQIVGAEPYATVERRSETDVSPKLGLLYAVSPDINTFVSWTRGFKGGGFNATSEVNENLQFEPERAQSFEAGFKSTWLDRSLRLNLSVYRTDVSNLQVVDFVNTSFRVSNAGEARLQGVEAEGVWLAPWPWLTVSGALGLSDASYLSYRNAAPTEAQGDAGQDTQDLGGRTLPNAPRVSAALNPTVSLPLPFGQGLGLRWSLDLSYRGDQYSATDLDPHSFQKGQWFIGSRVVLGPASEAWALILAGSNLSNQQGLDLVIDHSVYDNTFIDQQIPARSLSLSVLARF